MEDNKHKNLSDSFKEFNSNISDILKYEKEYLEKQLIAQKAIDKITQQVKPITKIIFADNTEFDITKGFTIKELMIIDRALYWLSINDEHKELKNKIGFLINMKINNKRENDKQDRNKNR